MRMEDPIPTFTYLVSQVLERHPDIAYLSVVEPGVAGPIDIKAQQGEVSPNTALMICEIGLTGMTTPSQSNDFLRTLWLPRPFVSAGRYTRESAIKRADETGELIAFGRRFISNVRSSRSI